MNQFIVLSFLAVISICTGFYQHHVPTSSVLLRARRGAEVKVEAPKFVVGENLPIEVSKDQAIYDMILVERISAPERTSVGLFLPKVEGKDQKHLGKVISMPKEYGLESECGRVQPVEEILPFNLGDIVYIRVCLNYLYTYIHTFDESFPPFTRIHGALDQRISKLLSVASLSTKLLKLQE